MSGADELDPSMKCYRKNGSDDREGVRVPGHVLPSMKCYRKNGSDGVVQALHMRVL